MKPPFKLIASFLGILLLIIVLIKLLFSVYQVASNSMEPTINKDDYIIVSRFHYNVFEPNRNDIVLFEPIEGIFNIGPWTHRVIAIEGDSVSVKDNFVSVNGNDILFPKVKYENLSVKVQKDFIFQKGDSEKTIIGEVHKEKIIGKVILIF